MNNCPQCSASLQQGAAFCDSCGASVTYSAPTLIPSAPAASAPAPAAPAPAASGGDSCPQCNVPVILGQAYCDDCGASLSEIQPAPLNIPPAIAPTPSAQAPLPHTLVAGSQPKAQAPQAAPSPQALPIKGAAPAALAAAAPKGNVCKACGSSNAPNHVFCDNCGSSLAAAAPPPPAQVSTPPVVPPIPIQQAPGAVAPPPSPPVKQAKLILTSNGTEFPFGNNSEILIGREDPISGIFPEVDLTSHGGVEGGVSRRHARIIKQGDQWMIQDLKSTNHTYVNRKKLNLGQREPVNNGDQVRIGRLVLTLQIS